MIFNIKIIVQNIRRFLPVLLVFGYLLLAGNGLARESENITMAQAIQMALEGNISLQQFLNVVYSDQINVKQSKANFLPNLGANFSASKNYPKTGNTGESFTGSITSNLNLFNGFYDVAHLKISRMNLASDTADYAWNRQTIVFGTVSQFMQVVLDSEFIRIATDNLQTQQDQLKQIEAFMKAGNRSRADVYQQLADMKQSELQLIQAQRDYAVSRLDLLQILGKPAEAGLQFQTLLVDSLILGFVNKSPEIITSDVIEARMDALSQKYQIQAARYQIQAARSDYWPSLSFSVGSGSGYRSGIPGLDFSDQFIDENPYIGIGLSFSLPLFDRFSTKFSVQQARLQLSTQQLTLQNLQLQIGSQIKQALLDYQTALKQREVAHAQYEYSSEALKISEERFRVGSATYIELSQVRANYYNAAYQKISADYNLLLRYMTIHYYGGTVDAAISIFN